MIPRDRDVAATLSKVAALRAFCLKLPHIPTPAEIRLLKHFEMLAVSPDLATEADIDAIAAGWREWWRDGEVRRLIAMVSKLSPRLIELDRRLSSCSQAAQLRRWLEIQNQIEHSRACINLRPADVAQPLLRREIPSPPAKIRVLFVGVAPTRLGGKGRGTHLYSNQVDLLRTALFRALDRSPFGTTLTKVNVLGKEEADRAFHRGGFFFIHAAKIRPTTRRTTDRSLKGLCPATSLSGD